MSSVGARILWPLLLASFATALPTPEYPYSPVPDHGWYQTEYAPSYDNYVPSDYHFEYAVSDPHTGDHKSQWEIKERGVVRGMYSLLEPDGSTRIVEYVADEHGFRATVKKLEAPRVHLHQESGDHHHQEVVLQPLSEAYGHGYGGAYSGQAGNYDVQGEYPRIAPAVAQHLEMPPPPPPTVYQQPLQGSPWSGVELHGFTGNADDDSSYTGHEGGGGGRRPRPQQEDGGGYYYGHDSDHNIGHGHNYVEVSEIVPETEAAAVPYGIWYQQI